MSKKGGIWYPKYVGDYHSDTMHLSCLEHGAYNLLLDAYWMNGGPIPSDDKYLSNVTKLSLSDWSAIRSVIEKFFTVSEANPSTWTHKRIEKELEIARNNKASRVLGAKSTNERRWNKTSKKSPSDTLSDTPSDTPSVSLKGRSSPSPSPSPSLAGESTADAKNQSLPECSHPSISEVIETAKIIGLAEWKAVDWFHEMKGCGWLDFNHRPVRDWRSVMTRVKVKWEADGRPAGPKPSRNYTPAHNPKQQLDFAP